MKLSNYIDHTNLHAEVTKEEIVKLCMDAIENEFPAVCITPYYASLASEILKDTKVNVCSVVGFPLGANHTEVKVLEAKKLIEDGADEIDVVINVAAFINGDYGYVLNELKELRKATEGKILKVIVEAAIFTKDEEKERLVEIVFESGADYIKTSTGIHKMGGAKLSDIILFRKSIGKRNLKIKASGGIRTREDAIAMISAGADRIGTSSGMKICG